MRHLLYCLLPLSLTAPVDAESLIPTRVIKAGEVITAEDIAIQPAAVEGMAAKPAEVLGQEARLTLYPGRPIPLAAIGPPATIQRNQIVRLSYQMGTLEIRAEGRALNRGGEGDVIKVMNLDSRTIIQGRIMADGTVRAGSTEG